MSGALIVRGHDKGKGARWLTVDPAQAGAWSWSTEIVDAYRFGLEELPRVFDMVRGKHAGVTVQLVTPERICNLSERFVQPLTRGPIRWKK